MKDKLWFKSYVPGVPKTINFEKTLVTEALARSAKNFPNNTALNYMGNRITYKKLNDMVNQFARALADLGVKKGDKVAVCLPNLPQTIISNFAILRLGAVAAQNNPLYTERELEYQLNDSDAKVVITLTLLVPRMQKIAPNTKIKKIIGCHIHSYLPFPKKQLFPYVKKAMYKEIEKADGLYLFEDLIRKYDTKPVPEGGKWEELSTLIYTGGTTGVSKGVMLSHKNISCNVQQFIAWFPSLKPGGERLVGTFPVFHSAGYTAVQNYFTWQAYEHIVIPRPDPKAMIDLIKKYKPTFLARRPDDLRGPSERPRVQEDEPFIDQGVLLGRGPARRGHHPRPQGPDRGDALRGLRAHRDDADRHGHAVGRRHKARHGRRPGPGNGHQDRGRGDGQEGDEDGPDRRDRHQRPPGHDGLLQEARGHARRSWSTAGFSPGTSGCSTTTATCRSWTARRT